MIKPNPRVLPLLGRHCAAACALILGAQAFAAEGDRKTAKDLEREGVPIGDSSYMPVEINQSFEEIHQEKSAVKEEMIQRQQEMLEHRYDLSDRPVEGVTMSGGKPVQAGVRVKLSRGTTWEELGQMTPDEIREQGVFPDGFKPLPHPFHEAGGMVFPQVQIDEINEQEGRDLTRFDTEFDLPQHMISEFPPPIFAPGAPPGGAIRAPVLPGAGGRAAR